MEARQAGEIHKSNSNLEMERGKTALLVQEWSLRMRMVRRLYRQTDVLQHSIQYRGLSPPRRERRWTELKPRWQ